MRVRKKINPKSQKDSVVKMTYSKMPFADGDILYLKKWGQEPKMKKVDDNWETDPNVMINWLYDYDIVAL